MFIAYAAGIWKKSDDFLRTKMMAEIISAQKSDRALLRSSDSADNIVLSIITGSGNITDYATELFQTITRWCTTLRNHFQCNIIRRTAESPTWDNQTVLPHIPFEVIKVMFDLYPRDTRVLHNVAGELANGKPQSGMFWGTKVSDFVGYDGFN